MNVRPSDGYWYREADGTKFKGTNWAQVIKKVFEFRRINGKDVGNPAKDVMDQACSRSPHLCHEQRTPQTTKSVPTLKGRVLRWLAEFASTAKAQRLEYVRRDERNKRVNVCIGCPRHKFLTSQCASCMATIGAHTSTILGKEHEPDRRVSACEVLGAHLPVATWLDEVAIDNASLPTRCWRKKA